MELAVDKLLVERPFVLKSIFLVVNWLVCIKD